MKDLAPEQREVPPGTGSVVWKPGGLKGKVSTARGGVSPSCRWDLDAQAVEASDDIIKCVC